jgi:uncharacterized protein YehS (DUF1456 family)
MNYNDILRRIRFTFDFDDNKMMKIFGLADYKVTRGQICNWMKKDDDTQYQNISDSEMAIFLNGFINFKRGRKDGPQPIPERFLNNNIVLRKLKIALDLQAEDVLALLSLANFKLSKHELSAFFRKQEHRQYRECKDQVLRNFLKGLQIKHREGSDAESEPEIEPENK